MKLNVTIVLIFVSVIKGSCSTTWPCYSNEDCTAEGSTCSESGKCECEFGQVFSSNYSKCLKTSLYDEKCEDSVQCNLMPSGANCNFGVCECNNQYTYVGSRCRLLNGLGHDCETDLDCYFGYDRTSVSCKNQICECADGYYNRYGNICRRKSMAINDACVVNTDCDELGNDVKCVNFRCTSPDRNESSSRSHREIAVQTSLEALELKPLNILRREYSVDKPTVSSIVTGKFARDEEDKTLSTLSNTDDDLDARKYGSSCTDNSKPCQGLPHSTCADNLCYCKQGYYHKNGKCYAELGEIAETADECEFEFEESSKRCLCKKNYYYERSLRSCRKPIQYHLSCTSHSQCSPFGVVYCNPVVPRRCTCEKYAEYDESKQMCLYRQGLGEQCDANEVCQIENSFCSSDHICKCKNHYVEDKNTCVKGIGAECKDESECFPGNSICEEIEDKDDKDDMDNRPKTCKCRKGYVHFQDECLKEAKDPDDECIDTEQCKPLLASCIDNKCICSEGQRFSKGKCVNKKELGETCTRAGECHIEENPESVECRNSVCQCKIGHTSTDQKTCIRVVPKKNSSGRPSALKIVTFVLIGSAFLITTAALKQAYY